MRNQTRVTRPTEQFTSVGMVSKRRSGFERRLCHVGVVLLTTLIALHLPALGQDDALTTYANRYLEQLGSETDTIHRLISESNSADFQSDSGLASLTTQLNARRQEIQRSIDLYGTAAPSDAPTRLRRSVAQALAGSKDILRGIDLELQSIPPRSAAVFNQGVTATNQGITSLRAAQHEYNAFVDEHNREIAQQSQSESPTFSAIGLTPLLLYTVVFGLPLAALYLYLLASGHWLNSSFQARLSRLTQGDVAAASSGGMRYYGATILIMFPYLYALLLFSILLLCDFALLAGYVIINMGRVPGALVIALVIVVLGSLWAIVKGVFGGHHRELFGITVSRAQQPRMWQLCDRLAKEVGTRPPDEIYISPEAGIGVHLSGGLFTMLIGRTRRVLTIGVPSISNLTVSEMEAILAHEFGHFSNKDTAWNSLTFTMAAALDNTLSTMPNPARAQGFWLKLTSFLNPALWLLVAYHFLFLLITSGFYRVREMLADKTAIGLYGCDNFSSGLMKVARNDYVFHSYVIPEMVSAMRDKHQVFKNVFSFMSEGLRTTDAQHLADIDAAVLKDEAPSVHASHPMLKERLAYARHFETRGERATDGAAFASLVDQWDQVTTNLSDLYSHYIAVVTGYMAPAPAT